MGLFFLRSLFCHKLDANCDKTIQKIGVEPITESRDADFSKCERNLNGMTLLYASLSDEYQFTLTLPRLIFQNCWETWY